jgi:5-methylcytosine-specific restriction endonuclease McrA
MDGRPVTPVLRLCPKGGATGPNPGLCPACTRADNKRRNQKRATSGRKTPAWQALRLAAIHRDNHTCQRCGTTGSASALTVHLHNLDLNGDHRRAALDDLTTLCRRCHGTVDAPRAHTPRFFE